MGMVVPYINEMTPNQRLFKLPASQSQEMADSGFKPKPDPVALNFRLGQEHNSAVAFFHHLPGSQRRKVPTAELDRQISLT